MPSHIGQILLLFLLASATLFSQDRELGLPFVQNYYPEDYEASIQNWKVVQDSAGLIYVANSRGLLIFDGIHWQLIPMPGGIVRDIVIDYDHKIYVGGKNYFGYLTFDDQGQCSLVNLADRHDFPIEDDFQVAQLHRASYGIFFRIARGTFLWSGDHFKGWEPSEYKMFWSFLVNDEIYNNSRQGLLKLDTANGFYVVENGEDLLVPISTILPMQDGRLLVGATKAFYSYDNGVVQKIDGPATEFVNEARLMSGSILRDGSYCFSTLNGGAIVTDSNLEIATYYSVEEGVTSPTVYHVYEDRDNNLWLSTNYGISLVEHQSPFSYFEMGERTPPIAALVRYQGKMLAGTQNGLYQLIEAGRGRYEFQLHRGIKDRIWDMLVVDDECLIVHEDGLNILKGEQMTELGYRMRGSHLAQSILNPDIVYVPSFTGLKMLRKEEGKWQWNDTLMPDAGGLFYISQDSDGDLWIDLNNYHILRVNFPSPGDALSFSNYTLERYDTTKGLPHEKGFTFAYEGNIFHIDDQAYQMYLYDESIDRFRLPEAHEKIKQEATNLVLGNKDDKNNFWIVDRSDAQEQTYLAKARGATHEIIHLEEHRITDKIGRAIFYDNDVLWHGGTAGIYRNEINLQKPPSEYRAFISTVRYQVDSSLLTSALGQATPKIKHKRNQLRFYFGANSFIAPEALEFQSFLTGYDEDWTNWNQEVQRDFTNLNEGQYQLRVRARNIYDKVSREDQFSFTILPPWYRSWWAYLFYLILVFLLTGALVRLRSHQLRREKLALQQQVNARTAQLQVQNEKLELQKLQLAQLAEDLKEVDQLKSRLLANISHEFRTPLTLIKGPLDQLSRFPERVLSDKNAQMMRRNTNRLLRLVNQLLDLSKIDAGALPVNLTEGNLYQCLRAAASTFSSHAARRNIDYQVQIPNTQLWASFDRNKMEEVIYNLLSNAFKFTPDGGTIVVICQHHAGLINIEVSDTGVGIPEVDQDKVFNRFYQIDNAARQSVEGSGIGLSLVKEFVDLMQGEITLQSSVGQGTSFFISIPVEAILANQISKDVVGEAIAAKKAGAPAIADADAHTVLLIEDNEDMRNYLADILASTYVIYEAKNGKDGLQKAQQQVPDLIISDVMMPEMDGMEFCDRLKRDTKTSHIPVILLTAKSGIEHKISGLQTGADAYLTKPFDARELEATIHSLIEQRVRLQQSYAHQTDPFLPKNLDQPTVDERFISDLLDLLEKEHGHFKFGVPQMQKALAMSKTQLHRKMKALTGQAPGEFLRNFRLKRASQLLSKGQTVTQVAFSVGFNNLSYFAKCFRELFEESPSSYAKKTSS